MGRDEMSDYVGKHLLVDCYGCKTDMLSSSHDILQTVSDGVSYLGLGIDDTYLHEGEDEIIVAAYGSKAHVCIHAYLDMGYAAIDIYSFDPKLIPDKTMKIIRSILKPERIRATSVKRGDMSAITDMKPKTKSKTTTLRKFRNTGSKINKARKTVVRYIAHKNEKRDGLGPE